MINKIAAQISLYGDAENIINFKNEYSEHLKVSLTELLSNQNNIR